MPLLAVAGGFAMLWGYELNVQLIGALTGQRATTLLLLSPAVALLLLPTFVIAAMDIGRERMRLSRTARSEEHTSELQSLMRISYAVFCLKKKKKNTTKTYRTR